MGDRKSALVPRSRLVARGAVEAVVAVCSCIFFGHYLEYLACHRVLGLHRVPLGPGGGADPHAPFPSPFGEHGWLPVPLMLVDICLLWNGIGIWHPTSWWDKCRGAFWGQFQMLAVCAFTILPTILAVRSPRPPTPLPAASPCSPARTSAMPRLSRAHRRSSSPGVRQSSCTAGWTRGSLSRQSPGVRM